VGFDAQCYRLGYGGGYFDRTLALLDSQQFDYRTIGIGYDAARLESIQPLPHDIALHAIVTELALIE
jgi:5,10-methenyltetrahydrofolate synthetase